MLRVATYNIRKCIGLDWQRRPDRIIDVLSEIDADVVMLQEADRRFGDRRGTLPDETLHRRAGLRVVRVVPESASHGYRGNAILVSEKIEVGNVEALPLPSLEPRGAVIAEVGVHGRRMRIVGAHLGLLAADRRRQVKALIRALEAREDGHPEALVGDFNEWRPNSLCLSMLKRRLSPAECGPSYHAATPVAPLDRIFVGAGAHVARASVHRSEAANRASDHLPVWADLRFVDHAAAAHAG